MHEDERMTDDAAQTLGTLHHTYALAERVCFFWGLSNQTEKTSWRSGQHRAMTSMSVSDSGSSNSDNKHNGIR